MEEGRKGGDMLSVCEGVVRTRCGCGGGGEKVLGLTSVSCFRMRSREDGRSQGGGRILARRWRFSRSASQSGRGVLCGGRRG